LSDVLKNTFGKLDLFLSSRKPKGGTYSVDLTSITGAVRVTCPVWTKYTGIAKCFRHRRRQFNSRTTLTDFTEMKDAHKNPNNYHKP
jgi:hypothetical protein